MSLTIKAATAMHFAGASYAAGDTIDTAGMDDRSIAVLLKHQPVYVSSASGSLAAFYGDEAMGAGIAPTLVLEASRWTSDADGVACQVDATNHNQVNILQDGTYAVTAQGFMYKAGTTGGGLTIRINRGAEFLQFDNEGQGNAADSGEVDSCLSMCLPLLAGDAIVLTLNPFGADNVGNVAQLLVCKIA